MTADPADHAELAGRANPAGRAEIAGRAVREAAPAPPPSVGLPVDPELPDPAVRATDPRVLVVIALGGAVSAPLRYALEVLHPAGAGAFPLTTFLVNVSGAFALGLFLALLLSRWSRSRFLWPLVATGFLGAYTTVAVYTTFSTYAFETVRLAEDRARRSAVVNVLANLLPGTAAAAAGLALARGL